MTILDTIFPVFAIAAAGYITTRMGLFNANDIRGMSRFVFNLAIPVLLFNALFSLELPPTINWQFLISFYLVVLLIFGFSLLLGRFQFGLNPRQQGVFSMGATYSNLGLVGLPIVTIGLGEEALLPMLTIIAFHAALLWFIGTITAERADNPKNERQSPLKYIALTGWRTIKSLGRNPIIIGLILGFIFNRLPQLVPTVIVNTLQIFGRTSLPCALFVLGGSLVVFRPKKVETAINQPKGGHFNGERTETAVLIILKLLIHPLLVYLLAFYVFHLEPLWTAVAVMAAGMPIGINAYMFAEKYQEGLRVVGTAVLISTLLAAGTQTILLAIFLKTVS